VRRVRAIEKSRNEESLREDFKYLKPILQMRTRPNIKVMIQNPASAGFFITQ
jgi:hypothetical protein